MEVFLIEKDHDGKVQEKVKQMHVHSINMINKNDSKDIG